MQVIIKVFRNQQGWLRIQYISKISAKAQNQNNPMSFIIKKFLRKLIEQYLNIYDQLNLEKGQLQLPSGHLNQANINKILRSKNIPCAIAYSEYTNLGINIPIIEILSKPIVIKMECLRVVVVVEGDGSERQIDKQKKQKDSQGVQKTEQQQTPNKQKKQKKAPKSQNQEQPMPGPQKSGGPSQASAKNQKSYFKSIITRLLTNMQIQIKKLQIIVRYGNKHTRTESMYQQLDNNEYKLSLENFVAKNSLSLLEANILKKIVCMSKLSVTVNRIREDQQLLMEQSGKMEASTCLTTTIAEVSDLNMCINIDYTRVTMICLLDKLIIGLESKLIYWVVQKVKQKRAAAHNSKPSQNVKQKQKPKKAAEQQSSPIQPDLEAIQLKINEIKFSILDRPATSTTTKNVPNLELYTLLILCLQISKQRVKKLEDQHTNARQKSSQITLHLHSITFLTANQDNNLNTIQKFLQIRMCQHSNKNYHSTIQGWNKNKRKQFKICLQINNQSISFINVYDVDVGLHVTNQIVRNGQKIIKLVQKYLGQFMEIDEKRGQLTQKDKKIGSRKKIEDQTSKGTQISNTKLPQITLNNIKFTVILQPKPDHPKLSVTASFPQNIKLAQKITNSSEQAQYKKCQKIENLLQIVQINIVLNSKCELVRINNMKFCYQQNLQTGLIKQQEIVGSVHEIGSNLDVFVLNDILGFLSWIGFKEFCACADKLVSQVKSIGLMVKEKELRNKQQRQMEKIKKEQKTQQISSKSEVQEKMKLQRENQEDNHQMLRAKSIQKHIYVRINNFTISIGSYHSPKSSELASKFNPIIIIQFESIKAISIMSPTQILKMNAKITLKTICAISPHNLSYSILLKNPITIKLRHNALNQDGDENENQQYHEPNKKGRMKNAMQQGNNYGISVSDPFYLDLHEQHILLISSLVKSIIHKPSQDKATSFTTITNSTNQPITILQNITNNPRTNHNKSGSNTSISRNNQMSMQQQQKYSNSNGNGVNEDTMNSMLTGNHYVLPHSRQEIYLFDLTIRVCINGEFSDPISLGLHQLGQINSNVSIPEEQPSSSKVQKSTSLIQPQQCEPEPNQPQSATQKPKPQTSSQKSIKPTPTTTSSPRSYKIEKGILFPYHQECRYILEIDYSNGYLLLNVKYKYELHLFEGIEGYCGLKCLEVRCIKFDRYEKFVSNQNEGSKNRENFMSLSWELLEQDKIEHITMLIQTDQNRQYKLSRLMTNSLKYKMYGLYQAQLPSSASTPCFHYYILQPIQNQTLLHNQTDTNSHRYYLMPYLVLINNLSEHSIWVNITNKKSLLNKQYEIDHNRQCIPIHEGFDYYMKQYMIKLVLEDYNANPISEDTHGQMEKYESEEHYFNTFFMVNEAFENVIELRGMKSNTRRYIRIRESFVHKTKILQIQDCLNIRNSTDYNLQLAIIPRGATAKNNKHSDNNGLYRADGHSAANYPNKIKKDDKLKITYLMSDNSIEVPVSKLIQSNNKLLLSYNFCRLSHSQQQEYYQILIKLQLKAISHNTDNHSYNSSNLQIQLIFSQFLIFTNVCSRGRRIRLNGRILNTSYDSADGSEDGSTQMSLCLPSNTNKDYNNKYMGIDMDRIYQDLLLNNRSWIMEGNSNYMQIQLLPLSKQQPKTSISQNAQSSNSSILYLHELISHKIIEHNKTVYCLVKSLKQDKIQLFFGDHLFSPNLPLKYFIFNNCTDQYFLMNSTQTQYAKYLLFPNRMEDEGRMKSKERKPVDSGFGQVGRSFVKKQQKISEAETKSQEIKKQAKQPTLSDRQQEQVYKKQGQQLPQVPNSKIHIQGKSAYPLSMMLNKQKHDIFLCDSNYQKLQPLTFRKLEKLKIKQQKYQIQNFTIIDLENQSKYAQASQAPQYSFSTLNVTVRISSRRRNLALVGQVKSINIRTFQNDKIDFLVQDVSIGVTAQQQANTNQEATETNTSTSTSTSNPNSASIGNASKQKPNLQIYQILRIPEQSYLLIEGKLYEQKVVLIRNIYMKCKIIDLHVNKQILGVINYFTKLTKYVGDYLATTTLTNTTHSSEPAPNKKSETDKIINLSKQKILLIRSFCIHPINLCLSVQTNPSMDFSNMITLPQFTISNKVYRMSSIIKQISNHYLTNIIAKFPKLSFIYQNLRSPIAMIRSILEARSMLVGNRDQERNVVMWGLAYVQLDRKYFGVGVDRSFDKRLLSYIVANSKKNDKQLQKVNQFLLQLTLQSPSPTSSTNTSNTSNTGNKNWGDHKQIFICPLKNIVSTNITKLSQTINIPISYYLTNKYIRVLSPTPTSTGASISQYVPIKQIQSIKVTRYNSNSRKSNTNAELIINFKRLGIYMKIVDQVLVCYGLVNSINSILM